jgi:hypothetical protein
MAISEHRQFFPSLRLHRMRPSGISIGAAPFRRDAPSRGSFFAAGAGLGGGRAARLGASTSVASAASSAASIAPSVVFALPSLSMRARFVTGLPSSARSFSPLLVCPCSPLLVSPCASSGPPGEVFHFSSDAFALAGAGSGSVRIVVISARFSSVCGSTRGMSPVGLRGGETRGGQRNRKKRKKQARDGADRRIISQDASACPRERPGRACRSRARARRRARDARSRDDRAAKRHRRAKRSFFARRAARGDAFPSARDSEKRAAAAACPAKSREFLFKRLRGTARLRANATLETRHARTEH